MYILRQYKDASHGTHVLATAAAGRNYMPETMPPPEYGSVRLAAITGFRWTWMSYRQGLLASGHVAMDECVGLLSVSTYPHREQQSSQSLGFAKHVSFAK